MGEIICKPPAVGQTALTRHEILSIPPFRNERERMGHGEISGGCERGLRSAGCAWGFTLFSTNDMVAGDKFRYSPSVRRPMGCPGSKTEESRCLASLKRPQHRTLSKSPSRQS